MLKQNKGVSLITLIITIIVVIILAVIVMRGTGGTIEQANYSSYMDDLGKVKEAVKTKAMEVKGEYLIDGRVVSMEEIYHYVAKGGKTGEDFVGKANVPAYTIIDREKADIGIEIPTRNIESGTARNVEIQYIVTKEGEVFAWPPYEYEDKLYITENITLAGKLDKNVQIEDESFTLDLDATLGTVLPTEETSGGTGDEGDDNQGGSVTPNPELAEIDVSEYIIYNSDLGDIECMVWEKKANGDIVIIPISPVGNVRIGCDEETTGSMKVASAAESYLNLESAIQSYCKQYTSAKLETTTEDIESLSLDKLEGFSIIPAARKYAYYAAGTSVSGTTTAEDGIAGYTKVAHFSNLDNDIEAPRFYVYDYAKNTAIDEKGNTYAYPTETDPVFVSNPTFSMDESSITAEKKELYLALIAGEHSWVASKDVYCDETSLRLSIWGVGAGGFGTDPICESGGYVYGYDSGVRPLITLSPSLKLDSSKTNMDGSESNPWQLTK